MSDPINVSTSQTGEGDTTSFDYVLNTTASAGTTIYTATGAAAAGTEAASTTSTTAAPSAKFPLDLDEYGQWVMFDIFSYSRASRGTEPRQGPSKGSIVLPIPADLSVGYGADYQNAGLGIGALVAKAAIGKGMMMSNLGDKSDDIKLKSIAESVKAGVASALVNAPGLITGLMLDSFGDVSQGASSALGMARNPHVAVLFKGVNLREHRFQYDFVPRSQEETTALHNVYLEFKKAMHPEYADAQNHLFKYPDEFAISFAKPQYLYRFQPCVLTGCTINYTAAGAAAFFAETKAPVAMRLTLDFRETAIVTKKEASAGF